MNKIVNLSLLAVGLIVAVVFAHPRQKIQTTETVVDVRPIGEPAIVPAEPIVAPTPSPGCPCGCATTGICTCADCPDLRDYNTAHERARKFGKPLVVVVCKSACPPCRQLEETLKTVDLSPFVVVHIDGEQHPELLPGLGVKSFPSIVVSGADDKWRSTTPGAIDAGTIRWLLGGAFASPPIFAPAATPNLVGSTVPASRGFYFSSVKMACSS